MQGNGVEHKPVHVSASKAEDAVALIAELKKRFANVVICDTVTTKMPHEVVDNARSFIARTESFRNSVSPGYLPPPRSRMGWCALNVQFLVRVLIHTGPELFVRAPRFYATELDIGDQGVRSFPVAYMLDDGTLCIESCNHPNTYQGAHILMMQFL